ncbi:MAG: O-antigen ligase family protein [Verrucomicrobiota bacterium]
MEIVLTGIKALIVLVAYLAGPPVLAWAMRDRAWLRRFFLFLIPCVLVRPPGNFTLQLYSIETYRGHTKGFEFNFLEPLALAFLLCSFLEKRSDKKLFVPGLFPYLALILMSTLSVIAAENQLYTLMAAAKFGKMIFLLVGVCNAIRETIDVRWLLRGFAVACVLLLGSCLYGRFVLGSFQVSGWFEHQNPMAMWSYQIGLILFAVTLARDTSWREGTLFFLGFGAAGLCIVLSVSRASLAAFGGGTVALLLVSLIRGVTPRRLVVLCLLSAGAGGVLFMAMDTLAHRFDSSEDSSPENDLRWILNKQSEAMLQDSPVWGQGWNNFGIKNSRPEGREFSRLLEEWNANRGFAIVAEQYYANPLTESHYWLILAENGYGAFVLHILFLLLTLGWCLKGVWAFRRSFLGYLMIGLGVALAITYLHSTLERVLTQTKNLSTWFVLLGMLARLELWRRGGWRPDTWDGKQQGNPGDERYGEPERPLPKPRKRKRTLALP